VPEQPDDRSPLARTLQRTTDATAIAFEMVVPILIGAWIDRRLGTKAIFAVLGGAIGMTAGLRSLLHMTATLRRTDSKPTDQDGNHHQSPS
jgi:F0F1-type ATP synthase assembly protein I